MRVLLIIIDLNDDTTFIEIGMSNVSELSDVGLGFLNNRHGLTCNGALIGEDSAMEEYSIKWHLHAILD